MSYFELNLETWRQLWRVLEMCDILLLIVDVRYAVYKLDVVKVSSVCAQKVRLRSLKPARRSSREKWISLLGRRRLKKRLM
ncbi:hypothetical protein HF086_017279 [Spodoptera exigua]|uniref:Uncharacterized protein n=1 Tax=Spodoptera exigua TaxID=7107 RepID=A0A922S7J6_SPOEX|nr:hypothetical protein HF086_017279 [Spodoptera exigua]